MGRGGVNWAANECFFGYYYLFDHGGDSRRRRAPGGHQRLLLAFDYWVGRFYPRCDQTLHPASLDRIFHTPKRRVKARGVGKCEICGLMIRAQPAAACRASNPLHPNGISSVLRTRERAFVEGQRLRLKLQRRLVAITHGPLGPCEAFV